MAFNIIETQKLVDDHKTLKLKLTGVGNAAWSGYYPIVIANQLAFANASSGIPHILSLVECQYSTDVAPSAYVQLYWVSTVNTNVAIFTFGTSDDGVLSGLIGNNANTPNGDIGIQISGAGAGNTVNMILTFYKELQGLPGNVAHYGVGSWANGYSDVYSGTPY